MILEKKGLAQFFKISCIDCDWNLKFCSSKECNRASNASKECNRASNASKECNRASNASKECNRASNASKECNRASNASKECNRASNASKECNRASNASKECNRASNASRRSSYEVNKRVLIAFRENGQGYSPLKTFCRCINMPPPMTQTTFDDLNCNLHNAYVQTSQECL